MNMVIIIGILQRYLIKPIARIIIQTIKINIIEGIEFVISNLFKVMKVNPIAEFKKTIINTKYLNSLDVWVRYSKDFRTQLQTQHIPKKQVTTWTSSQLLFRAGIKGFILLSTPKEA